MTSYNQQRISENASTEERRLQAQVEVFWRSEVEAIQLAGLVDGMRILEVGCSFGFYTEKLVNHFPNVTVVATDIDSNAIERARHRKLADDASGRIEYRQQAVEALTNEGEFDAVVARLIIEHVAHPADVLCRLREALRPGGLLICVSNDFGWHTLHTPDNPSLPTLFKAYQQARKDEGGNPTIGRELPSLLQSCGFEHIDIRTITAHSNVTGLDTFRASEGMGIPMKLVADNYLAASDFSAIVESAAAMRSSVRILFVASGKKTHG